MVMVEYHKYNANTPLQWGVSMVSENTIQMLTNNAKENAMLSDIYALCHFCPVPVPVCLCQHNGQWAKDISVSVWVQIWNTSAVGEQT